MPPSRSTRLQFPRQAVTAVVVCHDGAQWLPRCLEAVRAQRRRPQRVVVVDTGSIDGSIGLARVAGEEIEVVPLDRDAGFPAAVAAGVAAGDRLPGPRPRADAVQWVWVLHDDCAPDPAALLELLAEVERSPSATVLGCKQLDGDGTYLRQMRVTVDGAGRPAALDAHEVDQGQYDDLRDVLAVSTAGMLVRRDVWDETGGLDLTLPLFGDDVDFGWRVNAAGERVVVVPTAVVRHEFAIATGSRSADAVTGRPSLVRRKHEIRVLLANTGAAVLPWALLRIVCGGLLRALVHAGTGRFRSAADEVGAVGATLVHLPAVAAARRRRAPHRRRPHGDVRPLLAARPHRSRHGAELLLAAVTRHDSAERDRDTGWRGRPLLWLTVALIAVALVADRSLLTGTIHGGRLLPAPNGADDLWSLYRESWHAVGLGSSAPTPPWVAVVAALATLLLGKVWLAVAVLVLGAVPLAGWTAYAAGSVLTRSRWLRAWAAAAYALLPVATGAIAGGRLDVVVVLVLLPLVARGLVTAMLRRGSRGWRSAVGAGLLLAVAAAFAPVLWPVVALAGVAVALVAVRPAGAALGRLAVALAVPLVVLLPWSWWVIADPSRALRGAGLPETFAPERSQSGVDLMLLHPGGAGLPPAWLVVGYLLAGLAGLSRGPGGRIARGGFAAFVVAAAAAVAMSRLDVAGAPAGVRYWTGVPLAVAGLGLLCSAVVAAGGARPALARHSFGWRQTAAGLVTAAVAVASVGAAVVWVVRGADGPLTGRTPQLLPAFAAAMLDSSASPRAVVVAGGADGVRYALIRSSGGPRLGDADVPPDDSGPARRAKAALADAVQRLTAGDPRSAGALTGLGVTMVVVRAPDTARLDRFGNVDGLTAAPGSGVVVWRAAQPGGELLVLDPASAAAARGGDPATVGRAEVLPAQPGRAHARLPTGPSGRLLVLTEPADHRWEATLDGRPLPRSSAYGWAQAWTLPANGGRLQLSRHSSSRGWLLLGQLAMVIVLGLVAIGTARAVGDER